MIKELKKEYGILAKKYNKLLRKNEKIQRQYDKDLIYGIRLESENDQLVDDCNELFKKYNDLSNNQKQWKEAEGEKLVEEYKKIFDEYKVEMTDTFSDFVEAVFFEEMTIPDKVLEFASKGELYSELIDEFKIRLSVEEGLLDPECKAILKESTEEIKQLRAGMNTMIDENLQIKADVQEMAPLLYICELCQNHGLIGNQRETVFRLLKGETNKEIIDVKFTFILKQFREDKREYIQAALAKLESKNDKKNVAMFFNTYGADLYCGKKEIDKTVNAIIGMSK